MKVSQIKIELINSDGTKSTFQTIMPHEIAEELTVKAIEWKNNYCNTVTAIEEYQKSEKEFIL